MRYGAPTYIKIIIRGHFSVEARRPSTPVATHEGGTELVVVGDRERNERRSAVDTVDRDDERHH